MKEAVERTLAEPGATVVVSARSKLAYEGGMELRLEGVDEPRRRLPGRVGHDVELDGRLRHRR